MTVSIPRCKADVTRDYHGRDRERPALNVKYYQRPEYTPERIAEHVKSAGLTLRDYDGSEAAA